MTRILATYHVRSPAEAIAARAEAIAIEQSIEMPVAAVREPWILTEMVGQVASIEPLEQGLFQVIVSLTAESVADDSGQLLNMQFGNSSLHDDLVLQDVTLPIELARSFGQGPRIGLQGLRDRVGAAGRALTCSALKPQGLAPEGLARLVHALALGGIDYVKDDHGLADQRYSPFAERIPACAQAVRQANAATGGATRYIPSLTGNLDEIRQRIALMRDEGLDTAMLAPAILGFPNAQALTRDYPDIAFLSHPSLAGAARIAPACLAKLLLIIGMDGIIFPNHGGRFGYSPQLCLDIAEAARGLEESRPAAIPIPAGGMSVARVPEMLDFYGNDVMLLIGGGLLAAGDGLCEATAEFVRTVKRFGESNRR